MNTDKLTEPDGNFHLPNDEVHQSEVVPMNDELTRELISSMRDLQAAISLHTEVIERKRKKRAPERQTPEEIERIFSILEANGYKVNRGRVKVFVDSPHGGRVCGWNKYGEYFYIAKKISIFHENEIRSHGFVMKRNEWILTVPHIATKASAAIEALTKINMSS